jgi:GTPase SAR1 family protein
MAPVNTLTCPKYDRVKHFQGYITDTSKLVIVGKQSAGKSSLLQSLTDIPFPVGSKLCTRFATRIVSKRSGPNESEWVRASVEPGDVNPFNYSEDESDIEIINQTSISSDKFENIVEVVTGAQRGFHRVFFVS